MDIGLKLRWRTSHYVHGLHDGVRIRIEAIEPAGMEAEIFAYRQLPIDASTNETGVAFSHVCSPPDLEDYPKNAALPEHNMPWLRLSWVDLIVRSVAEAESLVNAVADDTRRLVRTLKTMTALVTSEEITIGDIVVVEQSSSQSLSSSAASEKESVSFVVGAAPSDLVFVPNDSWNVIGVGADSALDTPASLARVTLLPGQSAEPLHISGFDLQEIPSNMQLTGVSAAVRVRYLSDVENSSASLSDLDDAVPRVSAIFVFCSVLTSAQLLGQPQDLVAGEWLTVATTAPAGESNFATVEISALVRYNLAVVVVVTNPTSGREVVVEVDGAELTLYGEV